MTTAAAHTGTVLGAPAPARRLDGSLGVGSIVFMVVAAAAPLTVIGGAAPLGMLMGNGAGYPSMYAISAAILLLFSVGLNAMSRTVAKPGAFFTYVGHGLGNAMGLGAAYLALLVYTCVQVAVYAYLGADLAGLAASVGIELPWWVFTLAMVALVGLLGFRHVELSAKVLGVVLVAEIGIVLVLAAAVVATGGAEGLSLAPFEPSAVVSGAPGVGLMMAFAGFIGFEATAVFRDEARDPERTIPRATYAAVLLIGVFYTFAGWALVMAWGPSQVLGAAAADPTNMVVLTAQNYLGTAGAMLLQVLLLTSLFACVLSFHNVLTRYQHSMAGAGTLPQGLGAVHARHLSPYRSSLLQTGTAAALVAVLAALAWDPVLQVFTWLSGIATLGIVLLMALTSLAVVVHFARHRNSADGSWRTRWAPALAMAGLLGASAVIVAYFPMLVDAGWGLSLSLIAWIPALVAVGVVQARILRRRDRTAYDRMFERITA
ncbi:APC family permease [Kocuria rosea]|nr:APC family permease [Kocuria rosea]